MAAPRPVLIIIDDDPLISETLHFVLSKEFDVCVADSRAQAKSLLRQLDIPPSLALVDLGLPPTPHKPDEGFTLIGELLAHSPIMKIIVLSGQSDDANVKHALALGAVDFLPKPCNLERLREILHSAHKFQDVELVAEQKKEANFGLLGESPPMVTLRTLIAQFADAPFPVLIQGESGSGKELVAGCLHGMSQRASQPYLSVNCAAISPTLAESILFGHAKGAFTGAAAPHSGYFEDAGEGTLFLDEIGELPLEMQAKLLRVLENGEYQRVGETQTRRSKARIIAATNRDLREEMHKSRFRTDLYHRLSVFALDVPPLRELGDDRALLLKHFSKFYAYETKQQNFIFDSQAHLLWMSYRFPGNVRELRNIIIRLIAKYAGQQVNEMQLKAELDLSRHSGNDSESSLIDDEAGLSNHAYTHLQTRANINLDVVLKSWEKAYIDAALKITHGNLSQAAKLLGVNRTTLYSRIQLQEDFKG
ncbi:MAG: sigma-54-dependent Fis family transcriptional regulator [Methylophilaceae bacterium]|nr:sigma-54-dependent Fis family transcriptional regulator [Methylophilaceae bacterium]